MSTSHPAPEGRRDPSLLHVESLQVTTVDGSLKVLRDVSLAVQPGEILGVVGESGSGKTLTALAVLGLLPDNLRVTAGRIVLDGDGDLAQLGSGALRRLRGRRIAMVFQDPMQSLNPVLTVGTQMVESLRLHRRLDRRQARDETHRLLARVSLPDPERLTRTYPHQLSGGQQQRVMIAMALASEPDLLIADEPTTALDVTVQAQILQLLGDLRQRLGLAILLITHDLGLVAECCDRVAVLYAGETVEEADVHAFFRQPGHPYSKALIEAVPRLGSSQVARGIPGQIPEPGHEAPGCAFAPRCALAEERCAETSTPLIAVEASNEACERRSRCLRAQDLLAGAATP